MTEEVFIFAVAQVTVHAGKVLVLLALGNVDWSVFGCAETVGQPV